MKKQAMIAAALGALLVGTAAWAQAPGPGAGGPVRPGFSVPVLLSELSLFLPQESTQGLLFRGGGGQGGGQGGNGQTAVQGGQRAQQFRQLLQYNRDPKLYFTKEQIAALLPLLQALRQNPILTPSKAKEFQASVDALLSVAQKAEYADYQKAMQKAFEQIRQQFAAQGAGGGTGGQGQAGSAGATAGQGTGQQQGGSQLTPTQRAQRQLDAFIKVLQDRQKELGA